LLKQIKTAALIWLALYLMLLPTNAEQGGLNAGELLQLYNDPKSKEYVAKSPGHGSRFFIGKHCNRASWAVAVVLSAQ
jgi:hypothetical protein